MAVEKLTKTCVIIFPKFYSNYQRLRHVEVTPHFVVNQPRLNTDLPNYKLKNCGTKLLSLFKKKLWKIQRKQ